MDMEILSAGPLDQHHAIWQSERPRLAALCARLTGDLVAGAETFMPLCIESSGQ
jgi:hypothetical protein